MKLTKFALMAAALAIASAQPAFAAKSAASCKAGKAHYTLKGQPGFTLHFEPAGNWTTAASDLLMVIKTPAKKTLKFSMTASNGAHRLYAIPLAQLEAERAAEEAGQTEDAEEEKDDNSIHFDGFTAKHDTLQSPPNAKDIAPSWLFLPELRSTLWYGYSSLGKEAVQEGMDLALFELKGCK